MRASRRAEQHHVAMEHFTDRERLLFAEPMTHIFSL
jgi:hypothetical protein